jgi:hypothetical protein
MSKQKLLLSTAYGAHSYVNYDDHAIVRHEMSQNILRRDLNIRLTSLAPARRRPDSEALRLLALPAEKGKLQDYKGLVGDPQPPSPHSLRLRVGRRRAARHPAAASAESD